MLSIAKEDAAIMARRASYLRETTDEHNAWLSAEETAWRGRVEAVAEAAQKQVAELEAIIGEIEADTAAWVAAGRPTKSTKQYC